MADDYERMNALGWALTDDSNAREPQAAQEQELQQSIPRPRPRVPLPRVPLTRMPQPQPHNSDAGADQRGHQRHTHRPQNFGQWQGALPRPTPRRRVGVDSDAAEDIRRAMAKVSSQTPALREKGQKSWENDVQRLQYREFPPATFAFESIGTFHWPTNEYRPEEVLGLNFEALDLIRMQNKCFITWSRDISAFKVMGRLHGVRRALLKLRTTCFQIASRNITPARKYVSHWRTEPPCLYVHLDDYHNPQILVSVNEPSRPVETSKTPRADGEITVKSDLAAARTREACGVEAVKATLADALSRVHYLRGHIKFRIRLGLFVLTSHKFLATDDMWELSEYEEMTRMPQFRGRVTAELGDMTTEKDTLGRLQNADDLLQPNDAMQTHLSEVKPTYSAEFVFKGEAGNFQLKMSWQRTKDRAGDGFQLVRKEAKWTRLDRDTGKAEALIDLIMVDLLNGSALHFDMKTSQAMDVPRLPIELRTFGTKVTITTTHSPDDVHVKSGHGTVPDFVKVSTVYRYNIKNTDYTLELSKFKITEIPPDSTTFKKYESRWAMSVYRTDWDNYFALNERLRIGEKAEWNDDFKEWFPPEMSFESAQDGDGFELLMQKLGKIEKLVRGQD